MAETRYKSDEEKTMDFMPLSEAAEITGYTPEYLNLLSRKGKLKSKKIGRNWYTRKDWLAEFLAEGSGDKKGAENLAEKDPTTAIETPALILEDSKDEERDSEYERRWESSRKAFQKLEELNFQKSANSWMKIFVSVSSAVIIFPLLFMGTYVAKSFVKNHSVDSELYRIYSENQNFDSEIVNENTRVGKVAGEETDLTGIVLASENYRVRDLNVGGDIVVLGGGENETLEIGNIKSESFVAGKKDEVKLVISWQTNKTAVSELTIAKNNGQDVRTVKEDSYGFVHSVVVSGLNPGTSYVYQIKCKDRWANEKTSDHFGIYTASKPVSVIDLISNAVGEVFGWAIKK